MKEGSSTVALARPRWSDMGMRLSGKKRCRCRCARFIGLCVAPLATWHAVPLCWPADVPSVLNTLAFAPGVLLRLWRWLCYAAGLPLEVPAQARQGLDVAALGRGYVGLTPGHARVMGLFCRQVAHRAPAAPQPPKCTVVQASNTDMPLHTPGWMECWD